eukprot:s4340_g2.t2
MTVKGTAEYKSHKMIDGKQVLDVMSSDDVNQYFPQDERPLEKSDYLCRETCKITYGDGKDAPVTVIRAGGLSGNVTCIERFSEMPSFRLS